MNKWQRRVFGVLAAVGGAVGFSLSATMVLQGQLNTGNWLLVLLGIVFFCWGIWCGVQMIEGVRRAKFYNCIFWLLQVPVVQTPIIGYSAFCTGELQLFVKTSPVYIGFIGSVLGAQFTLNLGQPGARNLLGVNLVAAGIAYFLARKCVSDEAGIPFAEQRRAD